MPPCWSQYLFINGYSSLNGLACEVNGTIMLCTRNYTRFTLGFTQSGRDLDRIFGKEFLVSLTISIFLKINGRVFTMVRWAQTVVFLKTQLI
ncbi:hypothetical protein SAMN05216387_11121 [Nitrosovibrio tenuis]|uniref:Uncharacterized protein n=1 Tax=Nitrosovibrio tenuis TaxID=1233 RepID=A0A1H7Q7X8_9PROT|nr:hypothetical protein SAMN05216387_11121 [Nitrosovibrio tenuis]